MRNKKGADRIRPGLLMLGPFLASTPVNATTIRIFHETIGVSDMANAALLAPLVGCLASALLVSILSLRRPLGVSSKGWLQKYGCIACGVANVAFWASLSLGATGGAVVSGVVFGTAVVFAVGAWMRCYAMSVQGILLHGAWSCLIASLLLEALSLVSPELATGGFFLFSLVGALAPLVLGRRAKDRPSGKQEEAPITQNMPASSVLRSMLSVIWLPLLGFCVYSLASSTYCFSLGGEAFHGELSGATIASLVAIVLCLLPLKNSFNLAIEKLAIPILAAITLAMAGIPAGNPFVVFGATYFYAPLVFTSLYALATLCAAANAGEFSLDLVLGATCSLGAASSLVGLWLGGGLEPSEIGGSVAVAAVYIYFAVLIVNLGISSWRQVSKPEANDYAAYGKSLSQIRSQRVNELAEKFALTTREQQVLEYLGAGHGPRYIANSLVISESTARTHVRNIYRKLGISSKDEILRLFE